MDDCHSGNHAVYCVFCGDGRGLNQKGDTGMYEFDFVSVVVGYILGVLLYNSVGNILFLEKDRKSVV